MNIKKKEGRSHQEIMRDGKNAAQCSDVMRCD